MQDKTLILNKIKEFYGYKKDGDFAKFLGISPQVLSNWYSRNTFDIEKVYTKCLEINPHWLILGEGKMLNERIENLQKTDENVLQKVAEPQDEYLLNFLKEQVAELKKDKEELKKDKALLTSLIETKLGNQEAS